MQRLIGFRNYLFSDDFTVPEFLSTKYISSLDGIRACSICIVLMAHLNSVTNNSLIRKIVNGGLPGVHIFFVISGFLITSLLLKEKVSKRTIDLKKFYIRRFLRILPVAFLYVIVLVGLNYYFDLGIKWPFFIHQITFTENYNSGFEWQTKHYWSLSVEEQFYLIFPFLLKKSFKWYMNVSIALLLMSPVLGVIYHYYKVHNQIIPDVVLYSNSFLNGGLYCIIVGSLFAVLIFKVPLNIKLKPYAIGLVQCFLLFCAWFFFNTPFLGGTNMLIESAFISILIISTIYFPKQGFYNFLNLKIIKTIGVLSFSIYIWQQLFTYNQPWKKSFTNGDSVILNLLALSIVAYMSYNYFEKPFLILKNKFKS